MTLEDTDTVREIVRKECEKAIGDFLKDIEVEVTKERIREGWIYCLVICKSNNEITRVLFSTTD